MEQRKSGPDLVRSAQVVVAFAALTGLLYYGRPVLVPFVLAVFVFSMFSPTLDWLVLRLRFPRPLALAASFLLVLVVVAAIFLMVAEAIWRVVATATIYGEDLALMAGRMFNRLRDLGVRTDPDDLIGKLPERIPALATDLAGRGLDLLSTFLLMLIFVFFLLASRDPHKTHNGVYASIDRDVRRYLLMKTALSALMGVIVGGTLWVFRIELAVVFGLLAFVLDFIPSIGSVIATLLPVPVAIARYQDSVWTVVIIVMILGAVQIVLGNFVEPKVLGNSLHLHPVIVLLAIGFWGLVWGMTGALLAVPLTAIIRLVALRIDSLRPLANLIGGRIPDIEKH